ncbi:MAG TPA: thioredoxin-dependent thiol peroxidase [Longimicrobiales bacterium]
MLKENDVAPDFTLPADDGSEVTLSALRGRKVVLYFYPKDDTSGCTTQACGVRDSFPEFEARGAVVLGVSPDPVRSHVKFRDKYDLPFRLLADTDHAVAEAYGVWKEKSMYGRKYWGNERTTFIIDEAGRIARIFPQVKPAEHAELVLGAL